ncbi:hypothetical protein Tco_0329585 [Tanacetum coccineum]
MILWIFVSFMQFDVPRKLNPSVVFETGDSCVEGSSLLPLDLALPFLVFSRDLIRPCSLSDLLGCDVVFPWERLL